MPVSPSMRLTTRPLTPDLWPALEDPFGKNGACNGCWCMYWRIGSAYRKRPREQNKQSFRGGGIVLAIEYSCTCEGKEPGWPFTQGKLALMLMPVTCCDVRQ